VRESLVYAVGVAVSPVPIASTLLILTCRRARTNAVSFAAGWVVGLSAAAATFVVLVQASGLTDSSPAWIAIPELSVGAAFLAGAAVVWRGRHKRAGWIQTVDDFTAAGSARMGMVLSGANPKVLALSLGAAVALAESDPAPALTASTVVLFVAIGAAGVLIPFAVYLVFPSRVAPVLSALRAWLVRYEAPVLFVLSVAIGATFVTSGVGALRS